MSRKKPERGSLTSLVKQRDAEGSIYKQHRSCKPAPSELSSKKRDERDETNLLDPAARASAREVVSARLKCDRVLQLRGENSSLLPREQKSSHRIMKNQLNQRQWNQLIEETAAKQEQQPEKRDPNIVVRWDSSHASHDHIRVPRVRDRRYHLSDQMRKHGIEGEGNEVAHMARLLNERFVPHQHHMYHDGSRVDYACVRNTFDSGHSASTRREQAILDSATNRNERNTASGTDPFRRAYAVLGGITPKQKNGVTDESPNHKQSGPPQQQTPARAMAAASKLAEAEPPKERQGGREINRNKRRPKNNDRYHDLEGDDDPDGSSSEKVDIRMMFGSRESQLDCELHEGRKGKTFIGAVVDDKTKVRKIKNNSKHSMKETQIKPVSTHIDLLGETSPDPVAEKNLTYRGVCPPLNLTQSIDNDKESASQEKASLLCRNRSGRHASDDLVQLAPALPEQNSEAAAETGVPTDSPDSGLLEFDEEYMMEDKIAF